MAAVFDNFTKSYSHDCRELVIRNSSVIKVDKLSKSYDDFILGEISFEVPSNSIIGIVGENGAGKSTLLKILLGLTKKDGGNVIVFGEEIEKLKLDKNRDKFNYVSAILDENFLPEDLNAKQLNSIMCDIYSNWESETFYVLLNDFKLNPDKIIKNYSKGMKMKLSIAVSLSHQSKLFILDEPTTGIDPIARQELLDIFLELKERSKATILFSSHITSDVEIIADYILFIHGGKLVFYEKKEEILHKYNLIKGEKNKLATLIPKAFAYKEKNDIIRILIDKETVSDECVDFQISKPNLDDIISFYI